MLTLVSFGQVKDHSKCMTNPFKLYWEEDWTFQIVHMDGGIKIEAYGLGHCIREALEPNDNPLIAADRLLSNARNKDKKNSTS